VYLETDAPGGIVIRVLDDQNGSQRWSQTFPYGDENSNNGYFPGLGDVVSGVVYAANDNELLALDATTGRLLWQRQIDANETFLPPAVMDGVLYDNAYEGDTGSGVVYVDTGTGYIYSVNAATGSQISPLRLGGECDIGADPALTLVG
jgi:outer membrane protein assembly factor BamB